jgi:carbamoyltransferase
MILSPADALNMFFASDLRYLVMQDVVVRKEAKA